MRFSHPEYNRASDMYVSFADQVQLAKWSHDRGHNFTEDTLWFGKPVGIRANTKQHTIEHIHAVAKHYGIIPVIDPEEVAPSIRDLELTQ